MANSDSYQLAREFETARLIDAVRRTDDIDDLKACTISLLRLNGTLRGMLSEQVAKEIPIWKPPS